MRYVSKYISNSTWAVVDTEAPESVREGCEDGFPLLICRNGSQPTEISAIAMNIFSMVVRAGLIHKEEKPASAQQRLYGAIAKFLRNFT